MDVSPGGRKLVMLRAFEETYHVTVVDLRRGENLVATQLPGMIRRYPAGRAVVTRLLAVNADGSKQLQLVPDRPHPATP